MSRFFFAWLFLCVLIQYTCASHSTGVCTRSVISTPGYGTSYRSQAYTVTYRCGWWRRRRCTRVAYRQVSYSYSYTRYRSIEECCYGYSSQYNGCFPICSPGCLHGSCTDPNVCTCNAGWTGSTCQEDVIECLSPALNNCQQGCHNTIGSYTCYCNPGYTLDINGFTCGDINECESDASNNCQQLCHNNQGSYTCECRSGYELEDNGYTCEDVNECASAATNNCQQFCHNTEGSYTCACKHGYTLNADGFTCTPIA